MSKRKARRVVIQLSARNPQDPKALFKAVEQVFRPEELHLSYAEQDVGKRFPAERGRAAEDLETQAREQVGLSLDAKDELRRAAARASTDSDRGAKVPRPAEIVDARSKTKSLLRRLAGKGWWVAMRCGEIAELVGNLPI